jgi:hypothetical protein
MGSVSFRVIILDLLCVFKVNITSAIGGVPPAA